MECPNCRTKIKTTELIGRSSNLDASWYQVTGSELHCPTCDSQVTYTRNPQIIAGIGFIIYVCILMFDLLYPDNLYTLEMNLSGLFIFTMCMIYWHRKKDLILVK